jgi:hemerythrin-like domain-containing protein
MKITEVLTAEHAMFRVMFDHIERVLPTLKTTAEVKLLSRMAEELLHGHGESEQSLAYAALDHMLKEKGCLGRLYTEHREMDVRFQQAQSSDDLPESCRLLLSAILMSREHFRYEERELFPLIDRILQSESLETLGAAWKQKRAAVVG